MPFVSGKASSFFTVGAKTWRPKTADQQFLESQRKRMAEEEQMKKVEVQERIKTLDQVRKIEERTQALNELALSAELKAKEHELALRERQVAEAKHLEIAKLEIAKREGRESLSEADLARIKNERLRTENLARVARDHAIRENMRPVTPISMGPTRVHVPPPPPVPHPLPVHNRPPSAQSMHRVHMGPAGIPSGHMPTGSMGHRLVPPEPVPRMRRMSESLAHPPPGIGRAPLGVPNLSRGLGPAPYPNRHARRPSGNISAEMTLKAQAERLRRRRLETLDLKARQHNLKVQALRDLRKRELIAELRERGLQQREIETQVNLQAERERALTEVQLREIRDRDHRLKLKEKGLQEREILDHLRRRQENDREALRRELELLEHQLRRKEILEAELAIKRAMEKGESPPMGVSRPSIEEIETEGLLNDIYDDVDVMGPYHRHEVISESGMSAEYRPRTPGGSHSFASVGSRTPNINPLGRAPSVGHRTPHLHPLIPGTPMMMGPLAHDRLHEEQMRQREEMQLRQDLLDVVSSRAPTPRQGASRQATPQPQRDALDANRLSVGGRATPRMRGEEVLGDNLIRTPGRSRSQSFDHRRPSSAAMTARDREESQSRAREASRSRHNSQLSLNPEEVKSIARAESRAALREEFEAREEREKAENKLIHAQRLREDLRAREEQNRLNSGFTHLMATPSISQMGTPSMGYPLMSNPAMTHHQVPPTPSVDHRRTSSMMDHLEPNCYHDNHHLDAHVRPSSRASSRMPDYHSISRPTSRAGSIRADYSPSQPRLGLPSRPSSRNLTAEDLGLQFERESAERIPHLNTVNNDALLSARLQSAAVNSEINGGRRSRANSRVDPMDDEYRHMDRNHLAADLSTMNLNGGRSRSNSRTEMPLEDFSRSARSQLAHDFDAQNNMADARSRSNSHMGLSNDGLSPNLRREHYGSEIANVSGRRSRANSITQPHKMSPNAQIDNELRGGLVGLGRSPRGHVQSDLYAGQAGLGNLTNEELSHLSTEQLELILNTEGNRSPMRNASSGWAGVRGDDRTLPTDELGHIIGRHEGGSMGLEVGQGSSRGHHRRDSRLGVEESPLFGDPRDYHSPMDPPRPLSRAETTSSNRQFAGPSSVQRYDQPSESSMIRSRLNSPNTASAGYQMPSYHDPYLSSSSGDGYLDDDRQDARFDSEAGGFVDEGEFIITEKTEQPGARIVRRFGPVEASSRASPRSRYGEVDERQDMHHAVKNLITEANQRGANGVVCLRVLDTPDGGYLATGEAVYLETQ
ncbi:hypothetical protein PCANC_18529 [Puccinia coronata f. sp. avenae]|uniref:Uncharacterized protein n=1 Tax=Puccinia coronata f. sp. avenae TaxID=200324 RepID=A0A2N5SAY7_9BASI|nr:hypothetical protein PCASD_26325 [Puccinia coronata f. sp. avenae]PLW10423.1 hypothetical protein PCANC_18529 [Puccinia coronata f. sp. avenae]PLW52449.1 hypothetical protein PCASD_00201 [Puccinia coronata f. sp. avenae]